MIQIKSESLNDECRTKANLTQSDPFSQYDKHCSHPTLVLTDFYILILLIQQHKNQNINNPVLHISSTTWFFFNKHSEPVWEKNPTLIKERKTSMQVDTKFSSLKKALLMNWSIRYTGMAIISWSYNFASHYKAFRWFKQVRLYLFISFSWLLIL